VPAASRNDAPPILGILLKPVSLKRIDLIADDTRYRHSYPPGGRFSQRCGNHSDSFTPAHIPSMPVARQEHFVYHHTMDVEHDVDASVSRIAAAIGEPARARMLYCLVDGHARTSTELAMVAGVSPSTASAHLNRLKTAQLVKLLVQGKHRYYSLRGRNVARALEGLSVLAGTPRAKFVPNTPTRLRAARTCYDHLAGTLGVSLHDRFLALEWLSGSYHLTPRGAKAFSALGIDLDATQALRRRFAYACLDWSERRPHIGGALGAALLRVALKRKWVTQDLDSRALGVTSLGRREMLTLFGLHANA
jgi:DNA-binding transcriptional ArsR family regulator